MFQHKCMGSFFIFKHAFSYELDKQTDMKKMENVSHLSKNLTNSIKLLSHFLKISKN